MSSITFLALSLMFACAQAGALQKLTKFLDSAVDNKAEGLMLAPADILPDFFHNHPELSHHYESATRMKHRLRFYAEPKPATNFIEVGILLDYNSPAGKADSSLSLSPDSKLLTSHILRSKEHVEIFAPALFQLSTSVLGFTTSVVWEESDDLIVAKELIVEIRNFGAAWKKSSQLFDAQQLLDNLRSAADALDLKVQEAEDGALALCIKSDPECGLRVEVRLRSAELDLELEDGPKKWDVDRLRKEKLQVELSYNGKEKAAFNYFFKVNSRTPDFQIKLTNTLLDLKKISGFLLPIETPKAILTVTRAMLERELAAVVKPRDLALTINQSGEAGEFDAAVMFEGGALLISAQISPDNLPFLEFSDFFRNQMSSESFDWRKSASGEMSALDSAHEKVSVESLRVRMKKLVPQLNELVYERLKTQQDVFEESTSKMGEELLADHFAIGERVLLLKPAAADSNQRVEKAQPKIFKQFRLHFEVTNGSRLTIKVSTTAKTEHDVSSGLKIFDRANEISLRGSFGEFCSANVILKNVEDLINAALRPTHRKIKSLKIERDLRTEAMLII